MTASEILRVDSLSVRVAGTDKRVVRDVSFSLAAGKTLCVVGESGSGKSVTSLAMMGLLGEGGLEPAGGRILFEGQDVLKFSPRQLREMRGARMSMIFQEPMTALNPVKKVSEQIDEVLRIHTRLSRRERRDKVLEMLAAVRLPDIRRVYESYPHQLSGGQRQRIAIAMALILEPKLLIADEPTTALDVTTQRQILALISDLQRQHGTAVLFITHDLGVVSEIADRILVMKSGDVVEAGTRDEILMSPRDAYTRKLVSSVPSLVPRPTKPLRDEPVLTVRSLDKTYVERRLFGRGHEVKAVQDVGFTLRRGEILGVVGESGSGKSTVARCVTRLIDPSSGSIVIGDSDIATSRANTLRPKRRHIQIVFQDPYRSLNPRLPIARSLIEGPMNFGVSREEALRKAEEMLGVVGLPADAMARFPHQFSGGQRQRICIARALVLEPDILVADEAVSALDVTVQAQVLALLETIREKTGISVLFITHDLRVAAQICDSIIVMQKGRIVEAGPAATVLARPAHDYTRALIEAAPGRDWDFQNGRPLRAEA